MAKIKTPDEKLKELDAQLKAKKEKVDADYKAYRQKIIDKKKELNAKKRLIAAAEKKRNKKKETQFKIIIGGLALNNIKKNKPFTLDDAIKGLKKSTNKNNILIKEYVNYFSSGKTTITKTDATKTS